MRQEREVAKGGKLSNETGGGKTRLMKGRTGTRAKGAEGDKETIRADQGSASAVETRYRKQIIPHNQNLAQKKYVAASEA